MIEISRRPPLRAKRTERGWPGHFNLGHRCLFHRNTLLEYEDVSIVVSTVGLLQNFRPAESRFDTVGDGRYFETMAFHTKKEDTRWWDIDVTRQIYFDSPWQIDVVDADDRANDMHEVVVEELTGKLERGEIEG